MAGPGWGDERPNEPGRIYWWAEGASSAEEFAIKRLGDQGHQVWSERTDVRSTKPGKGWFFGLFGRSTGSKRLDGVVAEQYRARIEKEGFRQNQGRAPRGGILGGEPKAPYGYGPPPRAGETNPWGRLDEGRWDDTGGSTDWWQPGPF